MARAGFYAIESHEIRFGRDGEWYSDGERIANAKISALFSRSIRRDPEGGYRLQMGDERARIVVDDTPFVVRSLDGDPQRGFTLTLNDGSSEPLDLSTLRSGADNALYARVKGAEEARFLRPAHYALARFIEGDEHSGFAIECAGRRHRIEPRRTEAAAR
ncbi:MAG: DUF1285 domain-containing protein [Candidatus Binatia bacterium]